MKKYLPRVKFYQPKATGGGFLIFEWTLITCVEKKMWSSGLVLAFVSVDVFRETGCVGRKRVIYLSCI
jgi:hypothetical protein